MKFRIFKHITKFVAKNDNYIEKDFPEGPHIRMRLYVRILKDRVCAQVQCK